MAPTTIGYESLTLVGLVITESARLRLYVSDGESCWNLSGSSEREGDEAHEDERGVEGLHNEVDC